MMLRIKAMGRSFVWVREGGGGGVGGAEMFTSFQSQKPQYHYPPAFRPLWFNTAIPRVLILEDI